MMPGPDAPAGLRGLTDRVLSAAAPVFRRLGELRVLAYHDVRDARAFARQMDHLVGHYAPVDAWAVLRAMDGEPLPDRAVWVTFDDGDPSVVRVGGPILRERGIRATMFVCPSVVGTDRSLWFQAVQAALGDRADAALTELKRLPVAERHARVADWIARAPAREQCTLDELRAFVREGGSVCNHTWDHPLLDQIPAEQVVEQIGRAQDWIHANLPGQPAWFAYPNGNASAAAERALEELGLRGAVLFDHRLARLDSPLRVSRVRVNAHDAMPRFTASASGAHPAWMRLRSKLADTRVQSDRS